jgi:nucleotide-binding universal stress UspA family protein
MERALAVIQDSEVGRRLLREAADLAAGTDAELIVLHVVDETQYSGNLERKAQSGSSGEVSSIDETIENSRQLADRLAAEVVDGVEYRPMGEVGKLPDAILDAAAEHDCDHVFIVGERKSPAGKVVFGDHAQSVILRFDGPVTTIVGD